MAYKTKTKQCIHLLLPAGLAFCLSLFMSNSWGQLQYYRYVNKDGVKVISHSIPPEYAQKGYEVITHTGQVVQVVPPAPEPEDRQAELEKRAAERALLAEYEVLARRYSAVEDIYSARDRRLAHLDATIAILRSNIGNLNGQIDDLMSKAAEAERSGREVPKNILSSIEEIKAERATTEDKLQRRITEHDSIHAEYDKAVELFKQGSALEMSNRSINTR